MRKLLLSLLLTTTVIPAQADIVTKIAPDTNLYIQQLGIAKYSNSDVDSSGYAYITFKNMDAFNCPSNSIYFDLSTVFGKSAYSTALASKIATRQLSAVSFDNNGINPDDPYAPGVICLLNKIEVAE